ncbi:MAG: M48 family metalloprotease [Thiolinea sp.]
MKHTYALRLCRPVTVLLSTAGLLTALAATAADLDWNPDPLPGTAATGLFTGNLDEPAIGRQLFRQLRRSQPLIEDPELNEWLRALAQCLARQVPGLGNNLKIALSNQDTVNAYTLSGGIIIVHAGLVLTTDSESELAAVLAHEMAHVSQRHLNRMQADRRNNPLLTGIGLLAGAAVASKSGDAAQAIITGTMALQAQNQITYTQQYESEADRTGLRILAASGLNPQGMPHFLEKLERMESHPYGDLGKYLSTHPLTLERLSDTRSRAAQLARNPARENPDYRYAREKIRVLYDRNRSGSTALPADLQRYQQALQQAQQGRYAAVLQLLGTALSRYRRPCC